MPTDDDFREPLIAIHRQLDRLLKLADEVKQVRVYKELTDIETSLRGELDTIGVLVNFDLRDAN